MLSNVQLAGWRMTVQNSLDLTGSGHTELTEPADQSGGGTKFSGRWLWVTVLFARPLTRQDFPDFAPRGAANIAARSSPA